MPVVPNFLERLAFLRLNKGPAPIFDLFGAAGFRAVTVALDLGVFDALGGDPRSAAAVAEALETDTEGTHTLLSMLTALGYLRRTDEGFALTPMSRRWLTDAENTDMGPWFRFWADVVFPFWETGLERAVREGAPEVTLYEWLGDDADAWRRTQAGFRSAAAVLLEAVCDRVPVDGDEHVLDLGGGHGAYSIELCRRHPDLRATVLDHPAALAVAREGAAEAGLGDHIAVCGGDYLREDLDLGEGSFDLVLLFNVVHGHDAATNRALLERAREALAPGGRVCVLDQFRGTAPTPIGRVGLAFVDLTYRVTLGTGAPDPDALEGWLGDAGFVDVERRSIRMAPGTHLFVATRPD